MSEEKTTVGAETVSESPAKENVQDSSVGQYIAESKKYRERAQDAEARVAKLEKSIADAEEVKLKEIEDYKTLYKKASLKIENLSEDANKWNEYEVNKRNEYLEKHPEEERETLSKLDLETLEYVTNKINTAKPNAPEAVGSSKPNIPEKSWGEMSDSERRAFYTFKANKGNA